MSESLKKKITFALTKVGKMIPIAESVKKRGEDW